MKIYFMDGFDYGANRNGTSHSGSDIGGVADYGHYWYGGSLLGPRQFTTGYLTGQALQTWGITIGHLGTSIPGDFSTLGPELRLGAWIQGRDQYSTTSPSSPLGVFGFNINGAWSLGIRVTPTSSSAGVAELAIYSNTDLTDSGLSAVVASYVDVNFGDWIYMELYLNSTTGYVECTINGTKLQYSGSLYSIPATGSVGIHLGSYDQINTAFDHLWMSDGSAPSGTDVMAVAVEGMVSVAGGSGAPCAEGWISVGGTKYYGDPDGGGGTGFGGLDSRYWNTIYWLFNQDPSDTTDWTTAKYNNIDTWGLCYVDPGTSPTLYLTSMGLNYLSPNSGQPLISYVYPSSTTALSGTWTKTDATKTYVAHVNSIPAQDSAVIADYRYLYTSTPSCLQFQRTGYVSPYLGVGITFAEEIDATHHDWVTVNSVDFSSWFISGYKLHGHGDMRFQSNYVTVNYVPETGGSAYFQGVWDYANTATTSRWSVPQQVVKLNDSYDHANTRLKVRGQGRALSFRVTSESGLPFHINGWVVEVSSNAKV